MEERKYEFLLKKANLTREELDKHFEIIDKRVAFIKPGDLIFKRIRIGLVEKIKPFAQYKIMNIVDKQSGTVEVSNSAGKLSVECISDFYIEREYLKLFTYFPEINFFNFKKEPVSLFLSDILGFDLFNENDIPNFKLRIFPDYKKKECYIDVCVDPKFNDIAVSTLNNLFESMKLNVMDGILKRSQNLSHVVIAYLFGIRRISDNNTIWNFKFEFVDDIQVPELCFNYSYNVWTAINDLLLQRYYNGAHHEALHFMLNRFVSAQGEFVLLNNYRMKRENEILLHKSLLKAIKKFGYNESLVVHNLEKIVIPACENGYFYDLEGFI